MPEIFLYIMSFSWGARRLERIEMPDMKTCITAVESSRAYISDGDENEVGVVLFCAGPNKEVDWSKEWNKTE